MNYRFHITLSLALIVAISALGLFSKARSQMQYPESAWVSYSSFQTVTDMAVGRHEIYIATTGGVLRYDRYRKEWLTPWVVVRGREASIDLRGADNVDYIDHTGNVAVRTPRGAFLYDYTAQYWIPSEHGFNAVQQTQLTEGLFIDRPGATISSRSYYSQGNNLIMDSDLQAHELGAFVEDDWGNQWMGVAGLGVLQVDKHLRRGVLWELGLWGADVQALVRSDGWTISAGHNRERGITLWKPEVNLWDHLTPLYNTGLRSAWVNDVSVAKNLLLTATDDGLAQVDLRNGSCRTWTLFDGLWSNNVYSVAVHGDTAWIGTESGLNVLALPRGPVRRVEQRALKNTLCYRVAVDQQAVWVGGEIGLFRLDRKDGNGRFLDFETSVGGAVTALHSSSDELWVGRTFGIEVVDKQSLKQTGFPAQAFFGGGEVKALVAMDSLVFLGTNQGLWKLDRARQRWHQYTTADGLLHNRINALLLDGDHLLLGTPAGITRFYWNDPNRID